MPLSPEEKRSRHQAMFGVDDMDAYYAANFEQPPMASHSMNAMGLLSDVQDLIAFGNAGEHTQPCTLNPDQAEGIRKRLNMAKWILSHHLEDSD